MKIINQDITKIERGFILHCVNCQGVMGSGIAWTLRQKWPQVFDFYQKRFQEKKDFLWSLLGSADVIRVEPDIYVVNIYGQYDYGTGMRHAEYGSIKESFITLKRGVVSTPDKDIPRIDDIPVYIPYKFACALAGGDWDIVSSMIDRILPEAIICKYL